MKESGGPSNRPLHKKGIKAVMTEDDRPTPAYRGVPYPNLDLTTNDWTAEERAETVRWYELAHGTGDTRRAQFVPFGIDYNPAGFKRYRALVPALTGAVPRGLFFIHLYAVLGNVDGCLYEIIASRQNGFTKRQIIEALNYAFLSGGPQGLNAVAEAASDFLFAWEDDRTASELEWPEGWSVDPDAFKSGIDIEARTIGFSEEELESLREWHRRMSGEVPAYVDLWGRLRGGPYKAGRARFEVAPGSSLPIQIYPLMNAHIATYFERPRALRQAMLHCKALGVKLEQLVEVIDTAFVYGGEWKMVEVFTDEIVELFEQWESEEAGTS